MRLRPLITIFLGFLLIIISNLANPAGAVDEMALKQQQYNQKLSQLPPINDQLNTADANYQGALALYEAATKNVQAKQNAFNKAKGDYERASKDVDLVSPDKLAELARNYQNANNELKTAQEDQKKTETEKVYREKILTNLQEQKNRLEREILSLKADIFDLDLRRPVWVEGSGESILDENKTMKECEKLALDAALSDALERGGKAIIESVTQVEMFKVTKDEIKLTAKVQVLEQDTSGDYGKTKRIIVGDIIKYQAKVRVKVQSVNSYNPYREQLKSMENKQPVSKVTSPTVSQTPKVTPPVKSPVPTPKFPVQPSVTSGIDSKILKKHTNSVLCVAVSPDGQYIASGSSDKTINIWTVDGKLIQTLTGHEGTVNSLAFSPDCQLIVSGSSDRTIRIWDVNGRLINTIGAYKDPISNIYGVAFSPDGQQIASGSASVGDSAIRVWNTNGEYLQALSGQDSFFRRLNNAAYCVAFSPDGRQIAAGFSNCTIKIWNTDGTLLNTLYDNDSVRSIAFSPNGQLIASGSDDQTIKIWNIADGALLRTFTGHEDAVNSIAFSSDGQLIASGSWDKTIKIWSIDGSLLRTLNGHNDSVSSVAFSPDNQWIVSGSNDKTVRIWSLSK